MVLRSQDPKDVRCAHEERQKVLHKKDFRKAKRPTWREPSERPWRVTDGLSARVVLAAADVSVLNGNLRKLERRRYGRYVVGGSGSAGVDGSPAERRMEVDLASLVAVRSTQTRKRTRRTSETESFAGRWICDADSRMSNAEALDLALALSLSLEESNTKENVALSVEDADADAFSAFSDFDDDLISVGPLEEEDDNEEAEWVDLYEDISPPEAVPIQLSCERPTYAQMTKVEVT